MAVILNTLYTKKSNIKLVTEIIVSWKWKFCRETSESLLLNSWFSKLPLGIYSYTNSLCSSTQQYPMSFTRCACLNCPRNITSVCKPESNNMIKTEESINHQVIISHYPAKKNTHQPLSMSLWSIQVQELNSHRLSSQTGSKLIINEPFVNRSKTTLPNKVAGWEALCDHLQLPKCEYMKIGACKRYGEVLWKCCRAGITQIRKRKPLEWGLLCYNFCFVLGSLEFRLVAAWEYRPTCDFLHCHCSWWSKMPSNLPMLVSLRLNG